MRSASADSWNARLYDDRHSFVWKRGAEVVDLLDPQPGERILDLGCGTGHLTAQIAQCGVTVIGIDSSPAMVSEAAARYPNIEFHVADARLLPFDREFDAVFSNAALHWIPDADAVAESVFRALRPGGRFAAEFGGIDNIARIVEGLYEALMAVGVRHPETLNPWYYPSVGEYTSMLERHGFRVDYAAWFDRLTPLEGGEDGMRAWLEMFAGCFLDAVDADKRDSVIRDVQGRLRPRLFFDGAWHADYKRLRFAAHRPDRGSSEV
jgi:trans-aconitate 2-methyltransferase